MRRSSRSVRRVGIRLKSPEARKFVDEMLHQRRLYKLREHKARPDGAKTPEDAVEAIGALRELLADEDLLARDACRRRP